MVDILSSQWWICTLGSALIHLEPSSQPGMSRGSMSASEGAPTPNAEPESLESSPEPLDQCETWYGDEPGAGCEAPLRERTPRKRTTGTTKTRIRRWMGRESPSPLAAPGMGDPSRARSDAPMLPRIRGSWVSSILEGGRAPVSEGGRRARRRAEVESSAEDAACPMVRIMLPKEVTGAQYQRW